MYNFMRYLDFTIVLFVLLRADFAGMTGRRVLWMAARPIELQPWYIRVLLQFSRMIW